MLLSRNRWRHRQLMAAGRKSLCLFRGTYIWTRHLKKIAASNWRGRQAPRFLFHCNSEQTFNQGLSWDHRWQGHREWSVQQRGRAAKLYGHRPTGSCVSLGVFSHSTVWMDDAPHSCATSWPGSEHLFFSRVKREFIAQRLLTHHNAQACALPWFITFPSMVISPYGSGSIYRSQ